jgi:hypothetical protein
MAGMPRYSEGVSTEDLTAEELLAAALVLHASA